MKERKEREEIRKNRNGWRMGTWEGKEKKKDRQERRWFSYHHAHDYKIPGKGLGEGKEREVEWKEREDKRKNGNGWRALEGSRKGKMKGDSKERK